MLVSESLSISVDMNHRSGDAGEGSAPTWCDEAVEVTDDCAKRGPERGLIVHAAGDDVGQLGPLWCWKVVVILIELDFLWKTARIHAI